MRKFLPFFIVFAVNQTLIMTINDVIVEVNENNRNRDKVTYHIPESFTLKEFDRQGDTFHATFITPVQDFLAEDVSPKIYNEAVFSTNVNENTEFKMHVLVEGSPDTETLNLNLIIQ